MSEKFKIQRTTDPVLNTLARLTERWKGRRIKPSRAWHKIKHHPTLEFLALTEVTSYSDMYAEATKGVIRDMPTKITYPDKVIVAEVRVGDQTGTGVNYSASYVATVDGLRALDPLIDDLIRDSVGFAASDFYDRIGRCYRSGEPSLMLLEPVQPQRHLAEIPEFKYPSKRMRDALKKCSHLLDHNPAVKSSRVSSDIIEEEVRYVNSEGTVIRDWYYAISFLFEVLIEDKEGRRYEFYDRIQFPTAIPSLTERCEQAARRVMRAALERVDCPKIKPGVYHILCTPGAMTTFIHEQVTGHQAASNEILASNSSVLGIDNLGEVVGNPNLSIFSDPQLGRHGTQYNWGGYGFDYEGVPATRVPLIVEGKLVGFLADRNGAAIINEELARKHGPDFPYKIVPGAARMDLHFHQGNPELLPPLPRSSNVEVIWNPQDSPRNRRQLMERFLALLKQTGQPGLYLTDIGTPGSCNPNEGVFRADAAATYLVDINGKMTPVGPTFAVGTSIRTLQDIVTIDASRVYVPHRCGVETEEGEAYVRQGMLVGSGIIQNVEMRPFLPVRQ